MGGSALGAYVAKYLYTTQFTFSFEVINDYHLPGYVNEDTLVIVGSYSGTTEETVSGLQEALSKNAKVIVIATGGTLDAKATELKVPYYKINPLYNPCNQPRMGIGYSVFGLLTFLSKLGFIKIDQSEVDAIKKTLQENTMLNGLNVPMATNPAKQLAQSLYNKIPIFIAGEFLIGAIHAVRNQMNENTKSLAIYFPLPELDHHLLEALKFPNAIQNNDHYILVNSSLYSERISKRLSVTKEVIEEAGHTTSLIEAKGETQLAQILNTINFGSYVGYYLAMAYEIDPSPIVSVEGFKKKLG
jgi:glucose/mannose-6-phosphate isomerase